MTYEFQLLSYNDKVKFISNFADKLLMDYTEYVGEVDNEFIEYLYLLVEQKTCSSGNWK